MGKKIRPDPKKIHRIKFETAFAAFPNNMVIQVKVLWILDASFREIMSEFGMKAEKWNRNMRKKSNQSFVQGLFNFDNCLTRPFIGDTKYNAHSPHLLYIVYCLCQFISHSNKSHTNEKHYSVCCIVDKLISGKRFQSPVWLMHKTYQIDRMCVNVNHIWMV